MKTMMRKETILNIIRDKKKVDIEELLKTLSISRVTLNKYLNELEQEGYIYKIYGGVIINEKIGYEDNFLKRMNRNILEKKAIAQKSLEYIKEGDSIFLDSGTTIWELSKLLKNFENITVVSNSLLVLSELSIAKKIRLISLGGEFTRNHFAFVGFTTLEELENFHFDLAFLGADGVSIEKGLMTNDFSISQIEKKVIERTKLKVLLVDHTKIGKESFIISIDRLNAIDILITDSKANKEIIEKMSKIIKIVVAENI